MRIMSVFCFAIACVLLAARLKREKGKAATDKRNAIMGYLAAGFQIVGLIFLLAASV